jgi:diacylglycerol O-acyltransferase
MAGRPVRSILGWVPMSADQPLGVCLFSYNGALTIGVSTDARMIPDPDHFADLVEQHLAELASIADSPKVPGGDGEIRRR